MSEEDKRARKELSPEGRDLKEREGSDEDNR